MTLITVDALRKKYHDCKVVMFAPTRDVHKDNRNYRFEIVHMSKRAIQHAQSRGIDVSFIAEGCVRSALGKGNLFKEYKMLKELLSTCDGVFDVNGYAISSQFRIQRTLNTLEMVDLFTSKGIPYYFLPQSFGPFEFSERKDYIINRIRNTLPKAEKIFAREHEGYLMLKELIGDDKIVDSYDMVLQTAEIDMNRVFVEPPAVDDIEISTANNVAIIPNMRTFEHGSKEAILNLYSGAIKLLTEKGKNIYLISHSAEDIAVCREIKSQFDTNEAVRLIEDKINTWNFDALIRKFDFAIASRFHSIVHSYKAGVPCIALGWATKYKELLKALGQEKYLFDVRNLSTEAVFFDALNEMNADCVLEREVIKAHLADIQETCCFDMIDF